MRGLVGLDVDGTLMEGPDLLAGALELIAELRARSVDVALCSGRPAESLFRTALQLGGVSYVCALQGTDVHHLTEPTPVRVASSVIPLRVAQRFAAFADSHRLEVWWYSDDGWHVPAPSADVESEAITIGVSPTVSSDYRRLGPPNKLLVRTYEPDVARLLARECVGFSLVGQSSGGSNFEVTSSRSSRAKGLDVVAGHCDADPSRVAAAGNDVNDVGMLHFASRAFAFPPLSDLAACPLAERLPPPSAGGLTQLRRRLQEVLRSDWHRHG